MMLQQRKVVNSVGLEWASDDMDAVLPGKACETTSALVSNGIVSLASAVVPDRGPATRVKRCVMMGLSEADPKGRQRHWSVETALASRQEPLCRQSRTPAA